eukprot:5671499-Prymnesium_polylepis.1
MQLLAARPAQNIHARVHRPVQQRDDLRYCNNRFRPESLILHHSHPTPHAVGALDKGAQFIA